MQKILNLLLCLYICIAIISCVSDKDSSVEAFPETEDASEEKQLSRKEIIALIESSITDAEAEAAEKGIIQIEEKDAE